MFIAVDFDGTIVKDNHSMEVYGFSTEFLPGAREVLKALYKQGNTLVIWTLRDHHKHYNDAHITAVLNFLRGNDLDFFVTPKQLSGWDNYHKFPADRYIDDKAGFRNWYDIAIEFFGLEKANEIWKKVEEREKQ